MSWESGVANHRIAELRLLLRHPALSPSDRLAASINLANALADVADKTADDAHCDEAVALGEDALLLACQRDIADLEVENTVKSALSSAYLTRFELRGTLKDLTRSRNLIQASVDATPASSRARFQRFTALATVLRACFTISNLQSDLQLALDASDEGLKIDAPNDQRAKALSNKAHTLSLRYDLFHLATDLEDAIEVTKQAIECAEDAHTVLQCKSNLAGHFVSFAERSDSDDAIDVAIQLGQDIQGLVTGPLKAKVAHHLSYLHRLKYEKRNELGGKPQDLQDALNYGTDAANESSEPYHKAMFLDQVAICFQHAHRREPEKGYSAQAIELAKFAIGLSDPAAAASYANHLAEFLQERSDPGDIEEAIELNRTVLNNADVPTLVRIAAGQHCGFMQADRQDLRGASMTFEEAVRLIPTLAKTSLHRPDQQYVLGQLTGLSSAAASLALAAGNNAAYAFRIMERGRGVLIQLATTSRSRIEPGMDSIPGAAQLVRRHEELKTVVAVNSSDVKRGTDQASFTGVPNSVRLQAVQELFSVESELDVLAQQHGLGGNDEWSQDVIRHMGRDYAVAFCTTAYRCDAFLVSASGIQSVALPLLTVEDLTRHVRLLLGSSRITAITTLTYRTSNEQLQKILEWLWDVAVEPVLTHLGLLCSPAPTSPNVRICWITSGGMGMMPLHAAGRHTTIEDDCTMKQKMKDMTFTVTDEPIRAVAFTMAQTPQLPDLQLVPEEVESLRKAAPNAKHEARTSSAHALQLLTTHQVAHFACHAEPDAKDPSMGAIMLYDRLNDAIDSLSVYALSQFEAPSAWLAYLSACQTADVQQLDLMDEVIHIAAAFQIAGFPQVVGTLWQAEDEYAARAADLFYSNDELCAAFREPGRINSRTAIRALHAAVTALRAEEPELVLSWAQFVAFGA
ncbi:hypothetical protein LTR27_010936 [Elasticomyces elasticus]|nr:hypothetical protein LTR27_010936 [Elasticomyces elasticus]